VGIGEERAGGGVFRCWPAIGLPPFLLGPVQQGARRAAGKEPDDQHDDEGLELGAAFVVAALQGVLQLQFQLWAELVQVDALMPGDAGLGEPESELHRVGPPVDLPGGGVTVAIRQVCLRPQPAVAEQAGRPRRRLLHRRRAGQPGVQGRPARTPPPLGMQLAHPIPGDTVSAAGDPAGCVRLLAPPPGTGRRGKVVQVGPALVGPPLVVSLTEASPSGGAPAPAHLAQRAAEHRVFGVEDQLVAAELGANGGH
jgi:hypothetical protein